ncbi:MAG: beta-N-acetylhexosaminidase [Burkholderiales bacterium]|nr:beta-N-acetylhexosaminidase [Burkholderiales bacterium]
MSAAAMELGPVIAAVSGLALNALDRERLCHPLVGGVTLFACNYADRVQLGELCRDIHALRSPPLLICVDHEGGRVQRFRAGFTPLPPMRRLGQIWERDPQLARDCAAAAGYIMASELRDCGVDLCFAPVLDIDHGASSIIGDRAFHREPAVVVALAASLLDGMREGALVGVGKHFPGHGCIAADSHLELPVDARSSAEIQAVDLIPFRSLASRLAAVMPAHVVYPAIDASPAGFSRTWLREILRNELGFAGAIVSDDLGMQAAASFGTMAARAFAAFAAGCDLVLACTPGNADDLLADLRYEMPAESRRRLMAMFGATSNASARQVQARAKLEDARAHLRMVET